jgi:transcriptional regulator with XRE-family HTH domain
MNRNGLIKHIELWITKLGSAKKVAEKCGINVGSLSTILAGKYAANEAKMLQKIAVGLDFKESNWNIVRSLGNYKALESVWSDAKNESMWFAISNKAGSGKTATMEDLFNRDTTGSVILIQAEEWSARHFLLKIIEKTLGNSDGSLSYNTTGKGYKSLAQLMDIVANYFNEMSLDRPVLLIDEADKLKPSALRTLIPLFNRTEDKMGLILSGTENLQKEIERGVRLNKKGYDELESRFGRTYIHLRGATEAEVAEVCKANGVTNSEVISQIWGELEKVKKQISVRTNTGTKVVMMDLVDDFRRLKRLIKRESLKTKRAA